MKYLYKNEDGFKVERQIGYTWYYCDVLKAAIEKYGLSEVPDYDELDRIVNRINIYVNSSRFEGALGAPIYCTSSYASDLRLIIDALLKIDRKNLSSEQIQAFYKKKIKDIDKASEDYTSSLWTS